MNNPPAPDIQYIDHMVGKSLIEVVHTWLPDSIYPHNYVFSFHNLLTGDWSVVTYRMLKPLNPEVYSFVGSSLFHAAELETGGMFTCFFLFDEGVFHMTCPNSLNPGQRQPN